MIDGVKASVRPGLIAIVFSACALSGCVGLEKAASQTTNQRSLVPRLQYNWETDSVGEIFDGAVKDGDSNEAPFKIIVAHVPVRRGADLRVEFYEDEQTGSGEVVSYHGRIAELVSRASAPRNWIGVSIADNVLYVDVCEHYDGGCPTSIRTAYRRGSWAAWYYAIHGATRSRHGGRPAGANWTAIVPPMPKPSFSPAPNPILQYNPETRNTGEVFEDGAFRVIVDHRKVNSGADLRAEIFQEGGDVDHPQAPENDGVAAELRSTDPEPRNWLAVHFADSGVPRAPFLYVAACERYDSGCPTHVMTAFGRARLDNLNGTGDKVYPYPYKVSLQRDVRVFWRSIYSGRPDGAGWTAVRVTPAPPLRRPATPTPGPGSARHIVGGANFDETTYTNGPCSNWTSHMHLGKYSDPQEDAQSDVLAVASGKVGGVTAAVVTLHCEAHTVVETYEARLYVITKGNAKQIASLGGYTHQGGEGFENGPFPPQWISVSFSGSHLYVDTWMQDKRCDRKRDWLASTYAARSGQLVRVAQVQHHRTGVGRYCNPQGRQ